MKQNSNKRFFKKDLADSDDMSLSPSVLPAAEKLELSRTPISSLELQLLLLMISWLYGRIEYLC